MQDPRPRIRAQFHLFGDLLEPDECTRLLGIEPTDAGKKGDLRAGRRAPLPETFWQVAVETRTHDLDIAVWSLLHLFEGKHGKVRAILAAGTSALLSCAVDIYDEGLEYGLSPRAVAVLASLGAGLSIDTADYRPAGS